MADNEDDIGSTRTKTPAEPPGTAAALRAQAGDSEPAAAADQSSQPGESPHTVSGAESHQPGESPHTVSGAESHQPGESPHTVSGAESHQPGESPHTVSGAESHQPGESPHTVSGAESHQPGESPHTVSGAESHQPGESPQTLSGVQLADPLQSSAEEQSILVGTDLTGLGPDLANTTIIYVQPDGSLVEGSGLTAEEQQALLDQLTKQQIVQVSDSEAAQLLQQSPLVKTIPVHNTALDPSQLQQVINQVTKTQQQIHVQDPQQILKQQVQVHQPGLKQQKQVQTPQQILKTTTQNASQQLKTVAQQFAMQTGSSVHVVQKKPEPVRIQIQVPSKQEVKPGSAPQQKSVAVNHPQVKLSANGSLSSAQIIHIQPVVGQQGQQFFLQQRPGEPPIQLLLQSPAPVVGSLLPLVHKITGQTTSPGSTSSLSQKPAASSIRIQTPTRIKAPPPSTIKTPLTPAAKTLSIPLLKTTTRVSQSPGKPPAAVPSQSTTSTPARPPTVTPPPIVKDRDREKEKKVKKREKKAAKVQTRSGRVSRPPKYKAKDYKFIKTEDLADGHQSDSDDYSDMSVEEEGARKDGPSPGSSPSLTYSHKSRSHCCQTCDKAYIGLGGLNRHYKLNPTHGDPDLPSDTPRPLREDSQSQERTAGTGEEEEDKPAAIVTNKVDEGPAAAVGLRGLHYRGPGRPRGRGRGRGRGRARPLGPPPKVSGGLVSRRGRRGRPPKLAVTTVTAEQQAERRRDRLQELVEQCEDEELMDIVLPRLTKVLSLWELLLAKVEGSGLARSRFPDIYREFESLQAQVRQAAQDYIISPQATAVPLEVRNIEVARSLGILDEVNRMKVVPGASPLTNKNVHYMENSKMLPPSKRFKMENSVPVHQNGLELLRTGGPKLVTSTADSVPCSSGSTQTLPPITSMEVTPDEDQGEGPLQNNAQADPPQESQEQDQSSSDPSAQELGPETTTVSKIPESSSTQNPESVSVQTQQDSDQCKSSSMDPCQSKELQEGQEIYIQTEGLTVQMAEPGLDRIVIVNGPDGTTMHIQTPEGVPLEAVQALLGIEASEGAKAP